MEHYLGKDWQERYPAALSAQEKADIKSALLASLANGSLHLRYDLENLKVLLDYPEH